MKEELKEVLKEVKEVKEALKEEALVKEELKEVAPTLGQLKEVRDLCRNETDNGCIVPHASSSHRWLLAWCAAEPQVRYQVL